MEPDIEEDRHETPENGADTCLRVCAGLALAQNDVHHCGGAAAEPSPPAATSMPLLCASMMQIMKGMMGEQMSACMAELLQRRRPLCAR